MTDKYYLKSPKEQSFYRVLLIIMAGVGVANINWWNHKYSKKYILLVQIHGFIAKGLSPVAFVSMTAAVFGNYKNVPFDTLGIMLSILPICLLTNIKNVSATFKSYEKIMKDFMDKIHLYSYYMREKDDFIRSKLLEVEKFTRCTGYFIGISLMIDWGSWAIGPIINNFRNRDLVLNKTMRLQTCVYLWMPFDYGYDYERWAWVHFISAYLSLAGCVQISVFDTMNFAFVFNLIGHIKILKHSIKVRFAENNISPEEQKKRLTEIIKYHAFIVETFKDLQSAYGINVAGNYLQNLLEDSLLLYEMMFADRSAVISFGMMILVYVGELILMSFILEEIRRQSDELPDVLYDIPWEKMSVSNQKIFKLILMRVQPTLCFEAACGLKAGVKPMMSILKSTFSYFVILKSSMQRN